MLNLHCDVVSVMEEEGHLNMTVSSTDHLVFL